MACIHALGLGFLLLSAACVREPISEATPANAPETGAPPASGLLVRYALLVGGRGTGDPPTASQVLSRDELAKSLLDWDAEADSDELQRLFALHHLGEVARQAYELPASGGSARGLYQHDGASYELRLDVRRQSGDTVLHKAEIRRAAELLAAPEIRTRLAQRAILSTETGGDTPFLFFVVETSAAPAVSSAAPPAAPEPGHDGVYKVDGERIRPPKNIHRVDPRYTEAAREARVAGQVVLECIVDEEGRVNDVRTVRGLPEGLTEAAIEAISRWRFEPTQLDGKPVKVRLTLTINFKLDDDEKPATG